MKGLKEFEEKIALHNGRLTRISDEIKSLQEKMSEGFYWEFSIKKDTTTFSWVPHMRKIVAEFENPDKSWFTRKIDECPIVVRIQFYEIMEQFIEKAIALIPEIEGNR